MRQQIDHLTVRPIQETDKANWLPLWQDYLHFYRAQINSDVTDGAFDKLCKGQGILGLVAVDKHNQLLGLIHLIFHDTTWSNEANCYIKDVFVSEKCRGHKVAEKLFAKAYELADQRNCSRVYWATQEFNSPARSLYDTLGKRTSFIIYDRVYTKD